MKFWVQVQGNWVPFWVEPFCFPVSVDSTTHQTILGKHGVKKYMWKFCVNCMQKNVSLQLLHLCKYYFRLYFLDFQLVPEIFQSLHPAETWEVTKCLQRQN